MTSEGQSRQRLGDFEIGREIGRGGMGIVYEARQVSLNRKVALKVLAGSLGLTSKAVVRFRREAEAAAKLHHTNIVPIYATGEHEGTHYYAMELVEGPSLNVVVRQMRILQRGESRAEPVPTKSGARADARPPVEAQESVGGETESTVTVPLPAWVAETIAGEVTPPTGTSESTTSGSSTTLATDGGYFDNIARMIAEVADALDYAHNQGVIHRDIKPSNLLLSPAGRVSINDFGLARMLEQPGMTMTGEFVGSPLYMSPEQITAGRAPLDHRTDIYSLGAALYELLTLRPPFPGERRDQIIAQIIGKDPKSARRHNKKVPVDLETICLKAMEKDPDRRYQTAGQMAEDLRRFVNRFAISAKRAGLVGRTVKWISRRPAVAALIGVVIAVSTIAGMLAYHSHLTTEQARIAEGQRALDQAQVEMLGGRYDEIEHWLERAEVYNVDPGRIRVLRGLVALEQQDTEAAIRHLKLSVEQLPDSLAAHALLARAYFYSKDESYEELPDLFQKFESMTPVTPEDYLYGAWAISGLQPEKALEWVEKLASEHPTPTVHFRLGILRLERLVDTYDTRDIDGVLDNLTAAKAQMPDNALVLMAHSHAHLLAADVHKFHSNATLHEQHLSKAREEAEYLLEKHPEDASSYVALVALAAYEGRWDDAVNHMRRASDLPGFFASYRFWGLPPLLCRSGRYQEALAELDAMDETAKMSPLSCYQRAFVVGELLGAEAAEETCRRWLERDKPTLPSFDRTAPYCIYCFLGRRQDAVRVSREHLRQYLAKLGPSLRQTDFDLAVNEFVCGRLSDDELLGAANIRIERLRAEYLVGMTQLAQGERAEAIRHFIEVDRAGNWLFSEGAGGLYFSWAPLFLDRLREDPAWPPWIPVKGEDATTVPADEPDRRGRDDEESP
ncbi:MAG: protein kinase domain-containing protein [Planctomycetota bacterium]|jgi:tetratricopeptide (TPR) repeat protein